MGYAPHTAVERLRVARAIADLPLIADALEKGELAHSAVRELSRVAVPDTEETWLEATRGKSLREIEAMVSGRKRGDRPDDPRNEDLTKRTLRLELSRHQRSRARTRRDASTPLSSALACRKLPMHHRDPEKTPHSACCVNLAAGPGLPDWVGLNLSLRHDFT